MAGSVITPNVASDRPLVLPPDFLRKAHALLVDRFPPSRVWHKPLSILRQEARRALHHLFDSEFSSVKKPDREPMIEDILGVATGFGPLEELFRDDSLTEIMVLTATQVIARRGEVWVPTSVRFRNVEHVRSYFHRLAEAGERVISTTPAVGGFDVRLSNGFRVIGILPPEVLEVSPTAVFVRGETPPQSQSTFPSRSGVVVNTARIPTPVTGSTVVPAAASSRVVSTPPERIPEPPSDPNSRIRQRVMELLVRKCEAAGVYDLRAISTPEFQRIILSHVAEVNVEDRLGMDESFMQRLSLEILAGMNR